MLQGDPRALPPPGLLDLGPALAGGMARLREALAHRDDPAAGVHQARRAIKGLRALLRLLPGDTKDLDAEFKALASTLAPARDQRVASRMAAVLADRAGEAGAIALLREIAAEQDAAAAALEARPHGRPRIRDLERRLAAVPAFVPPKAAARRVARNLTRALRQLKASLDARDAEAMHDARTLVVRGQLQLEALRRLSGASAGRRVRRLDRLRDILGDHHDLAQVAGLVAARADVDPQIRALALGGVERAMRRLERRAAAAAPDALPRHPRRFRRRLARRLKAGLP